MSGGFDALSMCYQSSSRLVKGNANLLLFVKQKTTGLNFRIGSCVSRCVFTFHIYTQAAFPSETSHFSSPLQSSLDFLFSFFSCVITPSSSSLWFPLLPLFPLDAFNLGLMILGGKHLSFCARCLPVLNITGLASHFCSSSASHDHVLINTSVHKKLLTVCTIAQFAYAQILVQMIYALNRSNISLLFIWEKSKT